MGPEILIVGDASARKELIAQVRECGYEAKPCTARTLNRLVRGDTPPVAIIICTEDVEADLVLAGLRRTRRGASIPVILAGHMGEGVDDLADVLDLGGDQFVELPTDAGTLGPILAELAGPASGTTETHVPPLRERTGDREPARERGNTLKARGGGPADRRGTDDTVLGDLRSTLDRLEARLRERDEVDPDPDPEPRDDLDLTAMGFEDVPDVDADGPAESGSHYATHTYEIDEEDLDHVASFEATDLDAEVPRRSTRRRRADHTERLDGGSGSVPSYRGSESSGVLRGRRPARRERDRDRDRGSDGRGRSSRRSRERSSLDLDPVGNLVRTGAPELLARLHAAQYTGSVSFTRGRAEKRVWLVHGEVVFARSNVSSDRFVDHLHRQGRLTRMQYETARRLVKKDPRRPGQMLVEAGLVKSREVGPLLRDHLLAVVCSSFDWTEGSWKLDEGERCSETIVLETAVPRIILMGLRTRLEAEDIRERIETRPGQPMCPRLVTEGLRQTEAAAAEADRLGLSRKEEDWLKRFDGTQTVGELERLNRDPVAVLALVYTLALLGRVAMVEREDEDEVGPDTRDPSAVDADRVKERVRLAREADYFELLGLGRDASRSDVRRAHESLRATFEEAALEPATLETMEGELEEVRAALDEAREVLVDDTLRSAYLAHLGDP